MQGVCGTQRMYSAHVHGAKSGTIYNVADQDENDSHVPHSETKSICDGYTLSQK